MARDAGGGYISLTSATSIVPISRNGSARAISSAASMPSAFTIKNPDKGSGPPLSDTPPELTVLDLPKGRMDWGHR